MSRYASNDQRYSEGELSDSPEYQSVKETDDLESSLSLSEDDQNNDTLSIKPPQPQAGAYLDVKHKKRREHGSSFSSSGHRDGSKNLKRTKGVRDERKEGIKVEEKERRQSHDSKHDDRRGSKHEDLRERLDRERRSRKSKDVDVDYESSQKRIHEHKSSRSRRERSSSKTDSMDTGGAKILESKEHYGHKENFKRKKHSDIVLRGSSPEEEARSKSLDPDEDIHHMKDLKYSNVVLEDQSDEGEASSSPESPAAYNNESLAHSRDHESNDSSPESDGMSDQKRRKQEEEEVEAEVSMETPIEVEKTVVPDELPSYLPAIMGCRSVSEFQCLNKIEEGTYGVVYRAQDKRTDEIVALKRLKMEREKEGFPITSLREVSTLLKAQHENIVTVREIVVGSNMDSIFMVMDYVEHDLKSLMEVLKTKKQLFLPGEVKCLLLQLLRAVAHLHDNWILHRDLKTSNILLSHSGILKVGDFGLAREYGSPLKAYTSIVVTLWYRAPELLLGAKEYSTPIDVWSVGCIFGELLTLDAIFQGKFEADQINKIFKELGTPNDSVWPGYSELPFVKKATFTNNPVSNLRKRFSSRLSELGVDLMQKFLTYDPAKRITAEEALNHIYLKEPPYPIHPSMLPTWPAKSESNGPRKAQSPKPPSGGRAYKQLNDEQDVDSNTGFHMGNANVDRRQSHLGPGFSLRF